MSTSDPKKPENQDNQLNELTIGLDSDNSPPKSEGLSQDKLNQVSDEINANVDRTQQNWEQEQKFTDNKSTGRLT